MYGGCLGIVESQRSSSRTLSNSCLLSFAWIPSSSCLQFFDCSIFLQQIFTEWISRCCFWLSPSYGLLPLIPFRPPSPVEWLERGTATSVTRSGDDRRTRSTTRGCCGQVFSPITEASFRWSRSLAKGGADCGTTFQLLEEDTLEIKLSIKIFEP